MRLAIATIVAAFVAALGLSSSASAATPAFGLRPYEFVGAATNPTCEGVAGTDTVTAKWDDTTGNPAPSILLQKLGASSNCATANVEIITPLIGGHFTALTELGFDYKTGESCGLQFVIQTDQGSNGLPCGYGTMTDLGNGWTHVELGQMQIYDAITIISPSGNVSAAILQGLGIYYDEGTDAFTGGSAVAGTLHVDNISVNGQVVGSPTSPTTKNECQNGGWQNFTPPFKNQGDCTKFVTTGK